MKSHLKVINSVSNGERVGRGMMHRDSHAKLTHYENDVVASKDLYELLEGREKKKRVSSSYASGKRSMSRLARWGIDSDLLLAGNLKCAGGASQELGFQT